MTKPYTHTELQTHLNDHQIDAELIRDIGETPTVATAAEALNVQPEQVLKTLMLNIQPSRSEEEDRSDLPTQIVVVSYGEQRISKKKLAQHFGVGRKRVRMASAEQVLEQLGYEVGGVPPLGHKHDVPIYLDASIPALQSNELVYAGGGDDTTMMRIHIQELIRVIQPNLLDLAED